jgi:phage protein D
MNLSVATFTLIYNGKDISEDVSNQVLTVEYQDKVTGQADEISVTLEDTDRRWQNSWYPTKGDTLQLYIRSAGQQLYCGTFTVDEIECSGSTDGDIFAIKGIAASTSKRLRTRNSVAHENKSLREIANTVASNSSLTLMGNIKDIRFVRAHQYRETDLGFLNRIGAQYGYVFSVRGDQLTFTYYQDVEGRAPSLVLSREDLLKWNMKDSAHMTFKNGHISYHVPKTKKVVSYDASEDEAEGTSDDELEMRDRIEDDQQAESTASYQLHNHNSKMVGGEISLPGDILILAGNNVQLQKLGKFSGIYSILDSRHTISRDGAYQSSATVKRVKLIDQSLFK